MRLDTFWVWVVVRHTALHLASCSGSASASLWVRLGSCWKHCDAMRLFAVFRLFALKCSLFTWAYTHRYIDICSCLSPFFYSLSLSLFLCLSDVVWVSARINDALHASESTVCSKTATATATVPAAFLSPPSFYCPRCSCLNCLSWGCRYLLLVREGPPDCPGAAASSQCFCSDFNQRL